MRCLSLLTLHLYPIQWILNIKDFTLPLPSLNNYIAFNGNTNFYYNANINYFWNTETYYRITRHYPVVYFFFSYYLFYLIILPARGFFSTILIQIRKSKGHGFTFISTMFVVCFIDALITDDEPIFDPVEWSLTQSWILFIFGLAWVAENLISSRYGSYTGRDKRVWTAWYKTYWMLECWYVLSFGIAALFVSTPFYNELSYNLTMVVGWWDWYTRNFFFNFISLYTLILYISYYLQLQLRYIGWKKAIVFITIINIILGYILFSQFIISFFGYFTDPNWYHKSRLTDYIQLSHEPNKWAWGNSKRDHFSYHRSTTVLWFKTDLPMASTFLIFNIFFFFCLFFTYLYWVILLRRVYATQEVSYTYYTFCVSALRQFFYFFLLMYVFIIFTYTITYIRLPVEIFWTLNLNSWFYTAYVFAFTYPKYLLTIF